MADSVMTVKVVPEIDEDALRDQVLKVIAGLAVVKPGETLVVRVSDWSPQQVEYYQEYLDHHDRPFRVLVVAGDELAAVTTPAWLADVEVTEVHVCDGSTVPAGYRLCHAPSGITVEATTRAAGTGMLGKELVKAGKITINDLRAALGMQPEPPPPVPVTVTVSDAVLDAKLAAVLPEMIEKILERSAVQARAHNRRMFA